MENGRILRMGETLEQAGLMDSCTLEVILCNPAGMRCFNCLRPNVESDSDPVKMTSQGEQGEEFSVHELFW